MGKGSRNRQTTMSEQVNASRYTAPKKSVGKTIRNVLIGLLVAAFVGVGIFGLLSTTGVLMDKLTAFEIGDQKISALDYKIYYKTAEINLINQYGSTLQTYYGVDLTKPLETQAYGDGTWGDYLHSSTKSKLTETYTLYLEALANGYELAGDEDPIYQGKMAEYRATAALYNMDLDKYINAVYGSAADLSDLQRIAKIEATADKYYNDYTESLKISDTDIQNYYSANKLTFDKADYRSFDFPYETVKYTAPAEGKTVEEGKPKSEEEATTMTQANIAAAQAKADEFLSKITDEASFSSLAKEYANANDADKYADDSATLTTNADLSSTNSKVVTWCADDSRNAGDKGTVDSGSSITVVYFINRYLPEVSTATTRHILIKATAASENATAEEKAKAETALTDAKAKIEEINKEWESGEKTEDRFAQLAMKYSDDAGSVQKGGLYKDFSEGSMVAEFNDWVFDSSRKSGDTGIVKTTYGYHLIYFVGNGDYAWKVSARTSLINSAYSEYYKGISTKYATADHNYAQSLAY
ncbi:MAG: peptidylprolyl isomerase [Clostridiaceae bacterium]|nr:peptidylprolyl isomerase [Clostridiaceae bacterium]